jgi:hypothetical protein
MSEEAKWHRDRRAAYRAAGLCIECGAKPASRGKASCPACRATKRAANARRKMRKNLRRF